MGILVKSMLKKIRQLLCKIGIHKFTWCCIIYPLFNVFIFSCENCNKTYTKAINKYV